MEIKRINSIEQLKQLAAQDDPLEIFIELAGGVRSTKIIDYLPENASWYVCHLSDDTEEEFTSTQEMLNANALLIVAMKKGKLFYWVD